MSETLFYEAPLTRWSGDRGTYHLVSITGEAAEQIAIHARLHQMEFGKQRGFGSVKVVARIGETEWKSSVFPQRSRAEDQAARAPVEPNKEWILLVSKKVMRAQDLAVGDPVTLSLELY